MYLVETFHDVNCSISVCSVVNFGVSEFHGGAVQALVASHAGCFVFDVLVGPCSSPRVEVLCLRCSPFAVEI